MSKTDLYAELKGSIGKANNRLSRLEKAGLETTSPYVIASDYLSSKDRGRFRANKRMTEKELKQELKRVHQFLGHQESTVRGVKKAVASKYSALTGRDAHDFWTEKKYSTREISNLLKAFNLAEFKKASELMGASDQIAEAIREAVKQGNSTRFIDNALSTWREQQQGNKQADLTALEELLGL